MKDKVLHLNLHREWFDLIASGFKPEEYRSTSAHWKKRLTVSDGHIIKFREDFDVVRFRNGYHSDSPEMDIEFKGIRLGEGVEAWGAEKGVLYYIIALGEIYSTKNISIVSKREKMILDFIGTFDNPVKLSVILDRFNYLYDDNSSRFLSELMYLMTSKGLLGKPKRGFYIISPDINKIIEDADSKSDLC